MRKVRQVKPQDRFPTGDAWDVAVLKLTPEQLHERFNIDFERGLDDLDYYSLAAIADDEVGQFWLMMHDRTPMQGTGVLVDAAVRRDAALRAVERQLGLRRDDYLWVTDDECNPLLDFLLTHPR